MPTSALDAVVGVLDDAESTDGDLFALSSTGPRGPQDGRLFEGGPGGGDAVAVAGAGQVEVRLKEGRRVRHRPPVECVCSLVGLALPIPIRRGGADSDISMKPFSECYEKPVLPVFSEVNKA